MRKKIIIGNWKMNKSVQEVREFFSNVEDLSEYSEKIQYGVAPTMLTLLTAEEANTDVNLIIAAQDAHFAESGAYTGNVSYSQLKAEGINYVIIGHSERREMFNDTDSVINKKVISALKGNQVPILCCGETLEQFEAKKTIEVVKAQLEKNLSGIDNTKAPRIVIAYEPIWAIGTGKTATPEIAQDVCHEIRKILADIFDQDTANKIRIQYGGSVKPTNVKDILAKPDIDGALVGGASLDPVSFAELIKNA